MKPQPHALRRWTVEPAKASDIHPTIVIRHATGLEIHFYSETATARFITRGSAAWHTEVDQTFAQIAKGDPIQGHPGAIRCSNLIELLLWIGAMAPADQR